MMALGDAILATVVVLLGAAGTFLLLPHAHGTARPRRQHGAGAIAAGLGLFLFMMLWTPPGPFLATLFFYVFALAAVAGGLMTITSRNPVYSALWFASVVLATAGLFLLAGAPFLAAGTVIVYAGAIIVTFLFVIMLAQMEGKALYDRAARAPGPATFTCFLLLWCLVIALSTVKTSVPDSSTHERQMRAETSLTRARDFAVAHNLEHIRTHAAVLDRALRPESMFRGQAGAASRGSTSPAVEKPNVAGLGESLYTVHLVTVALAGVLLFVALVGAVAITNPKRAQRPLSP
jgi:NADH-quinone oxidoreductase subunit J